MRRLGQRFVTRISRSSTAVVGRHALPSCCCTLAVFTASVISTLNGGFHKTGNFFPFTVTSAKFFTSPKSSITRPPCSHFTLSILHFTLFRYVAVPEKYLIPASRLSLHDTSFGNTACAGASHPCGKETSHAPVTSIAPAGFAETVRTAPSESLSFAVSGFHASTLPSRHSHSGSRSAALSGTRNRAPSPRSTLYVAPSYSYSMRVILWNRKAGSRRARPTPTSTLIVPSLTRSARSFVTLIRCLSVIPPGGTSMPGKRPYSAFLITSVCLGLGISAFFSAAMQTSAFTRCVPMLFSRNMTNADPLGLKLNVT